MLFIVCHCAVVCLLDYSDCLIALCLLIGCSVVNSVVIMSILLLEWHLLDCGLFGDTCGVCVWLGIGLLVSGG